LEVVWVSILSPTPLANTTSDAFSEVKTVAWLSDVSFEAFNDGDTGIVLVEIVDDILPAVVPLNSINPLKAILRD
jgi:hypothetical protein